MKEKTPDWLQQRKQQIDAEEQTPYFKIPQGETEITVDMDIPPAERTGDYSKQYIYTITVNGEARKLSASEYLDKMIIEALCHNINPFTLVRKGTGKQTRYSIKELA